MSRWLRYPLHHGLCFVAHRALSGCCEEVRVSCEDRINYIRGNAMVSEAERSICRRAAVLTTELELLEARFAQSGEGASAKELDLYQRASGNLRRLLESIGLRRRQRDVTPTLSTYLESRVQ